MLVPSQSSYWLGSMALHAAGSPRSRGWGSHVVGTVALHAALFIVGTLLYVRVSPHLGTGTQLYLAFLATGALAWSGLLFFGLGTCLAEALLKAGRAVTAIREARRFRGRLAVA